jgi:ABC-2 type transport system ATP-binding protein
MDAEDLLEIPLRKLSLGQRMRCELIASLLHTPKILFLDEPTIGLDAVSKIKLREFITEQNRKRGATILLTTHDMADIEQLCTRVMVIGKGKILFEGNIEKLRKQYAPFRYITIHTDTNKLFDIPNTKLIMKDEASLKLEYRPEITPTNDLITQLNKHYTVKDLIVENPDIERVISNMYEGEGL